MGFNKRFLNLKRVIDSYNQDPDNGIKKLVGKSDAIIFENDGSFEIVEEWMRGDKEKAIKMIEDVPGILAKVS